MARYKIEHITNYDYNFFVHESMNQLLLYPIIDKNQTVHNHTIGISKNPQIHRFKDKFANEIAIFNIIAPHKKLNITSRVEVELKAIEEPNINNEDIINAWKQIDDLKQDYSLNQFLSIDKIESLEAIQKLISQLSNKNLHPYENAKKFSEFIFTTFKYKQGVTSVETGIDEIWQIKSGVCQDFAHFLLVMLRLSGIPSRYVSGYICPKNQELRGEGATHAWVEIYLPNFNWIGIDPTNNCIASDRHVRLAVGRSFYDCSPIKGMFKGKIDHTLEVTVIVKNCYEANKTIKSNLAITNEQEIIKPSFISVSKSEATTDNSYLANKQMQQQVQMQQ